MVEEAIAEINLTVLELAEAYLEAGLSIIPITSDGAKQPDWTVLPQLPPKGQPDGAIGPRWYPYQKEPPTLDQVQDWFSDGDRGIALVCGAVSGNLHFPKKPSP